MERRIIAGIAAAVAVAIVAGVAGISIQAQQTPAVSGGTEKVKVIASFFPLYDFARNVGGDRADVSVMVPAGVEPHDWEPTPQNIASAGNADLIIYNGAGFESWVSQLNVKNSLDTSRGIELMEGGEHEESELDFHIWLDPVLAMKQVESIRDGLVQADPENADYYRHNAGRYLAELESLDDFIRSELSNCEKKDFIAFHSAFSYFANRYGLTQHSIHGGLPEGEVLPQRISEIKELATELGINVIYSEDLVDPRLADVIAGEIPNGRVLVLSPIEGLNDAEQQKGLGYIDKMEQNVKNLKVGFKCQQ